MRAIFLAVLYFSLAASAARAQWWTVQTSGIDTNLRGVSAAYSSDPKRTDAPVVWASGSNGVILRSLDEGKSWKRLRVAGGESLDFRGIAAIDERVAYVLSIGLGDKSRIYKTSDGGETWKNQFTGATKETFLDAIVCLGEKDCFALGDPVGGKFLLFSTTDGEHWKEIAGEKMPPALANEGAFAASNSSLCVDDANIYFATGGADKARVFHSPDSGATWSVAETPIAAGNASSGIFSIDCKAGSVLYAAGGDYKDVSRAFHSAAYWHSGTYLPEADEVWHLSKQQPGGFRSGIANVYTATVLAVGPSGEDISHDFGVTWQHTDSLNLNAITILDIYNGWAVGPKGTVARFINHNQYEIRERLGSQDPVSARRPLT